MAHPNADTINRVRSISGMHAPGSVALNVQVRDKCNHFSHSPFPGRYLICTIKMLPAGDAKGLITGTWFGVMNREVQRDAAR